MRDPIDTIIAGLNQKPAEPLPHIDAAELAIAKIASELVYVQQIGRLLRLPAATVRHYTGNKQKYGHLVPPFSKLGNRVVWRIDEVRQWLKEQHARTAFKVKRKVGRPRKGSASWEAL